ncbi:MAG: hypothetical protein ACFE9T_12725 [Promethearchaeota archaeon]
MSDKEIVYDIRLEEQLDELKFKIWMNEELQIQPKNLRQLIIENFLKTR